MCGESITDKAWTEAPRLFSHLYIWGVMINIVSQLNIFCMFKSISLIKKQYHKQIWIGTLQSINCL